MNTWQSLGIIDCVQTQWAFSFLLKNCKKLLNIHGESTAASDGSVRSWLWVRFAKLCNKIGLSVFHYNWKADMNPSESETQWTKKKRRRKWSRLVNWRVKKKELMNFGLAVSQRHMLPNLEFTSVTDWSRHLLDHYSSRAWYSKHNALVSLKILIIPDSMTGSLVFR